MTYDPNNVFAKILRGEIPCRQCFTNEFALAFHDIAPAAPTHLLVIPKGGYANFAAFVAEASPAEQAGFWATVATVAAEAGLSDYRLITNNGGDAGQTVHHFHVHILGGKPMSALLP